LPAVVVPLRWRSCAEIGPAGPVPAVAIATHRHFSVSLKRTYLYRRAAQYWAQVTVPVMPRSGFEPSIFSAMSAGESG